MSIYRDNENVLLRSVYSISTPQRMEKSEAELAADAQREEAGRRKRSRGAPCNVRLPLTWTWATGLPPYAQPQELMRLYPRIANLLAAHWDDPKATWAYFDELLVDKRGSRNGFPPTVLTDLLELQKYYLKLHPQMPTPLEYLRKG